MYSTAVEGGGRRRDQCPLVELLLHIAHRVGVKAEEKVDATLLQHVKKVMGKTRILYKLAKAAKGQPDGVVKEVKQNPQSSVLSLIFLDGLHPARQTRA